MLTAEQVAAAHVVDWGNYHTKVLESIVEQRGTNKTNASRRSIAHANTCSKLKTSLPRDNSPDIIQRRGRRRRKEEEEDSPSILMTRDQLVALCEQYNLGTFGNKSKLLDRIRKHRREGDMM